MLYGIILAIHVVVCIFLVIVVLLQSGKGADVAATFSMSSQTAFGPRGAATALSRATSIAVVVFMLTSITLTIHATKRSGGSVLDQLSTSTTEQPAKK
jgi:preprotein translocase subunit SecG